MQRNSSNVASIVVSGTLTGTHDIEARFNSGVWQTIATAATNTYGGNLTNCPTGQGLLEVRFADNTNVTVMVSYVGVGDVFAVAGQSNASGQGINQQSYSNATLQATLFSNAYTWENLADPIDSDINQVDTVSSDPVCNGSVWPLVATYIMADQNVPVSFVPCPLSSTSIGVWEPSANHLDRSTLYGSMNYRSAYVGGIKAVLWWQGETDAQSGMSQATYTLHLNNLANEIGADLSVKIMPCKFQNCTSIPDANETAIYDAIADVWTNNVNAVQGPDLSGIDSDDSFHLKTDAKLDSAAALWWSALQTAFYP